MHGLLLNTHHHNYTLIQSPSVFRDAQYLKAHTDIILYKYKNEVGCRDDTVPKTVDTRRHCEEE